MRRQIITIDEERCTGCGLCVPDCPEGALRIIDGKARLIGDLFCDGLGACIGHCPEGAITIETREAEAYDEAAVMENIARQGPNVIAAHIAHLEAHGEHGYVREALAYLAAHGLPAPAKLPEPSCRCGETEEGEPAAAACPGSRIMDLGAGSDRRPAGGPAAERAAGDGNAPPAALEERPSRLRQWPVQIMLVPTDAPFLAGADLLVAADCVAFALPDFHERLLDGRVLLVGCPKLDDAAHYLEKLTAMFERNDVRSVTVARMEVPCCSALVKLVRTAIERSGKKIPFAERTIGIRGNEL
jgi:ferredoxin